MLIKQNKLADDASFAEWLLRGLSYEIVRVRGYTHWHAIYRASKDFLSSVDGWCDGTIDGWGDFAISIWISIFSGCDVFHEIHEIRNSVMGGRWTDRVMILGITVLKLRVWSLSVVCE